MVGGDFGNGTSKFAIYNESNLALVKSWTEDTNFLVQIVFGETTEIIYKITQDTATTFTIFQYNQTTNAVLNGIYLFFIA